MGSALAEQGLLDSPKEANRLDVERHTASRAGLDSQSDWITLEFPREVHSPSVE